MPSPVAVCVSHRNCPVLLFTSFGLYSFFCGLFTGGSHLYSSCSLSDTAGYQPNPSQWSSRPSISPLLPRYKSIFSARDTLLLTPSISKPSRRLVLRTMPWEADAWGYCLCWVTVYSLKMGRLGNTLVNFVSDPPRP